MGACLSACWDTTPQEQTPPLRADPPGADIPQEQTPPRSRHPQEQTPPRADTPPGSRHPSWEQTSPKSRHTPREQTPPIADTPRSRLRHTVNERPVRILLECILVSLFLSVAPLIISTSCNGMCERHEKCIQSILKW